MVVCCGAADVRTILLLGEASDGLLSALGLRAAIHGQAG
jgi:hypothetical protein